MEAALSARGWGVQDHRPQHGPQGHHLRVGRGPPPLPPPDTSRRGFLRWGWPGIGQSRGGPGTFPALVQLRGKAPLKQDSFIPLLIYKVCSGHPLSARVTVLVGQKLGTRE